MSEQKRQFTPQRTVGDAVMLLESAVEAADRFGSRNELIEDAKLALKWLKDLPSERGEVPTQFKAVGYVDHEDAVHWEPGRKPTRETMIYVTDGKRG